MAAYQRPVGSPSEDDLRSTGAYSHMNDSIYATPRAAPPAPRGDLAEIPLSTLQTHDHHNHYPLQSTGGQYSPNPVDPPARRVMHHSGNPADANADHADADTEDSDDDERAYRDAPSTSLAGANAGIQARSNSPGMGKWNDQYGTLVGSKRELHETSMRSTIPLTPCCSQLNTTRSSLPCPLASTHTSTAVTTIPLLPRGPCPAQA